MELVVLSMLFYLCRAVARCICHPVDSTRGATALWPHYWAIWPFFFLSLHCGGHSLWSPVFWKLHYTFFPYSERNKGLSFEKLIMNQCTHWKLLFALWLNGKGILHLFINAAFLISLYNSYTWIWRLTLWLRLVWCWPGLAWTKLWEDGMDRGVCWKEPDVVLMINLYIGVSGACFL